MTVQLKKTLSAKATPITVVDRTAFQALASSLPAATRAWLAAHPRFSVTYAPRDASWLNMIEQWSGVLTRRLLRRGDFASRGDLDAKITALTIRHNKNARTNGITTPTPNTPATRPGTPGPRHSGTLSG